MTDSIERALEAGARAICPRLKPWMDAAFNPDYERPSEVKCDCAREVETVYGRCVTGCAGESADMTREAVAAFLRALAADPPAEMVAPMLAAQFERGCPAALRAALLALADKLEARDGDKA